jgi:hypothetical protein
MGGFRIFDKAKEAKEQLAEKAGEMSQHASERAEEMKALAVTKAADVKEQVAEQTADAREAGLEKMGGLLDDFNAALPVLNKAGFTVKGVNIELGVPPKLVAEFHCAASITEEEVDILTQENADHKFTVLLLRSLLQAWKLHSKFHIAGMKVNELAIEIGLLPVVTLKFA